jgi:hypothetical protein
MVVWRAWYAGSKGGVNVAGRPPASGTIACVIAPADLDLRAMRPRDLDVAIEWAAAEGWNPGLHDADAFYGTDPDGFLMGFVDGEPATSISVVRYGPTFAFLGLYICRRDLRGRGYGLATWTAGMATAGDRTVGLDGVVARQADYRRSGFVLAHRNVRYTGIARMWAPDRSHIVDVADPRALVDYDAELFGAPRPAFAVTWTAAPRRTLAWIEDGSVRGYATARVCRTGHKIGPLFADDDAIAEALLAALTSGLAGAEISLDVPEPNDSAVALAARAGLEPSFETARMYRGPAPAIPLERVYGITTFELG